MNFCCAATEEEEVVGGEESERSTTVSGSTYDLVLVVGVISQPMPPLFSPHARPLFSAMGSILNVVAMKVLLNSPHFRLRPIMSILAYAPWRNHHEQVCPRRMRTYKGTMTYPGMEKPQCSSIYCKTLLVPPHSVMQHAERTLLWAAMARTQRQ